MDSHDKCFLEYYILTIFPNILNLELKIGSSQFVVITRFVSILNDCILVKQGLS